MTTTVTTPPVTSMPNEDGAPATFHEVLLDSEANSEDVSTFPAAALPEPAHAFVTAMADELAVPDAIVGLPVLGAMATAIGDKRRLRVTGQWVERPILFGAVVAPSGAAKSPAMHAALGPVYAWQDGLRAEHAHRQAGWLAKPARDRGPEPRMKVAVTSDVTRESLVTDLAQNPHGVLLHQDELASLVNRFDEYRRGGGDRQFYLSLHAGEPVTVSRKTAAVEFVREPLVNIVGGLQPALFKDFDKKRGEDGFAWRFLYAWPEPWLHTMLDPARSAPPATGAAYARFIADLYALAEPLEITLEPRAFELFKSWHDQMVDRMNMDPDRLAPPLRKLIAHTLRLALIVHTGRVVAGEPGVKPDEADTVTLVKALMLASYFEATLMRVVAEITPQPDIATFYDRILRCAAARRGRVTVREACRALRVSAAEVREAFSAMVDEGFGQVERARFGGEERLTFVMACKVSPPGPEAPAPETKAAA